MHPCSSTIWTRSSVSLFILSFLCCSLIHFSSLHPGHVSRAAGRILPRMVRTNPQTLVKNTCASTFVHRDTKPSPGVNEVLEFLKAAHSQQTALFYSPPTPPPHLSLATGPVFLVASLHLTFNTEITAELPSLEMYRSTQKWQRDGVHLKRISAGFIIAELRASCGLHWGAIITSLQSLGFTLTSLQNQWLMNPRKVLNVLHRAMLWFNQKKITCCF